MGYLETFLFGMLIGAAAAVLLSGIVLVLSKVPGRKGRGFSSMASAAHDAADRKYMDKWKDAPSAYTDGRPEISADWRSYDEESST